MFDRERIGSGRASVAVGAARTPLAMPKAAETATFAATPGTAFTAAFALVAAIGLAGCASGPDYKPPQPTLEASFVQATSARAEEPAATFWRGFNDAQLDALIDQALLANTDVKLAQARLQLRGFYKLRDGFLIDRAGDVGNGANDGQ